MTDDPSVTLARKIREMLAFRKRMGRATKEYDAFVNGLIEAYGIVVGVSGAAQAMEHALLAAKGGVQAEG